MLHDPLSAVSFPPLLPAVSLGLIVMAAALALFAWWRGLPRLAARVTPWDLAAAFAFLGCAAAILGEVEHVIEYFWPQGTRTKPAHG